MNVAVTQRNVTKRDAVQRDAKRHVLKTSRLDVPLLLTQFGPSKTHVAVFLHQMKTFARLPKEKRCAESSVGMR